MPKPKLPNFTADQFTATEWDTAEQKAAFANKLAKFILTGFPKSMWTKAFYKTLHVNMGFIAHYSIHGFWAYYFENGDYGRIEFLENFTDNWISCVGDPGFTYSDVAKKIKSWIIVNDIKEYVLEKAKVA